MVVASRNNAASSTVRASGPLTLSPHQASSCGASETRSRCGLIPNNPHQPDGMRIEPPPSEPRASGASPAATAAPLPPLLPPGDSAVSHGLRVTPNVSDSVNGKIISSGTLVLPMITAPAARSALTTAASWAAGSDTPLLPHAVSSPATSLSSLIATGTPSSGSRSPASRRRWAAKAS